MLQEALHVNIKSFNLVREITDQDLFAKVELKPVCRLIIFNLANMYNPKLGYTFPGIDKLARCTGYTERQIKTGLKELFEQGLIVRTDKKIYFTRKFYELLNLAENTSSTSEDISPKSEESSPPCHEQIKEPDKKQNVLSFQLTEFQKQYQDVFSNLSEYELKKYKALKGYEKEDWLKTKRKEIFQDKSSKDLKQNFKNLKENTGSPLDLPIESALEVLKNLPPNSFFAKEIRKKWSI